VVGWVYPGGALIIGSAGVAGTWNVQLARSAEVPTVASAAAGVKRIPALAPVVPCSSTVVGLIAEPVVVQFAGLIEAVSGIGASNVRRVWEMLYWPFDPTPWRGAY
jgi:hypothetical protein